MKKNSKKNLGTVKTLKKDVKIYLKLQKEGENAKAWYASVAVKKLFENLEITLDYVYQMNKQEFDITILFAMELIHKFQSEELARVFIWKYNDFYKDSSKCEKTYEDIISLVYQYIENDPDYNRLDFTKEMKEMMRGWKGETLQSYIENADDDYVTVIRLCIENRAFDIDNEYMAYWYSRENTDELTCFSCVERKNNKPLLPYVVGGQCKQNIINERIENIYVVKEIEVEKYENGEIFEFLYEKALIFQTESRFYVFWRHLIFDRIEIAVCDTMESAVESIKELNEADEDMENVTIIKKKIVEDL